MPWGQSLQTPVPPAAGGFAPRPPASGSWRLRPQTPIGLRQLGAPPPDPQISPPFRIFVYAPEHNESYVKLRQEYDSCEKCCSSLIRAVKKGERLNSVRWRQARRQRGGGIGIAPPIFIFAPPPPIYFLHSHCIFS